MRHLAREFGYTEAVALLESKLDDDDRIVSYGASEGLDWASYNAELKPLVAACARRQIGQLTKLFAATTDLNALEPLKGLILTSGEDCVPRMLALLPTLSDEWQRKYAIEILERFRASPTQSRDAILESLASNDVGRRKKACYDSVHVIDEGIVRALIEVLERFPEPQYNRREDVYQSTRTGAAYALGKAGIPLARETLRKALKDDGPWGVANDGTLVRGVTGMRAFGTSVRKGLEEADTDFARAILAGK